MTPYTHSRVVVTRFLEESMTHISGEQRFRELGKKIADYDRVHLEVWEKNTGEEDGDRLSFSLRYRLAEKALEHKCELVADLSPPTQVDGHIILRGSGLRMKTGYR